ncbi:MAG: carbohydrate ABC transporter permease [Oscillospiraceae bacterium]|jgi:multiple sugar transport system permease protein|nr:carbohydrate ABC transporter permease [Oscillospiraceae bacterium]
MAALHPIERKTTKGRITYWVIIAVLCVGVPLQVFPYLWMLSGVFKSNKEIMKAIPTLIPKNPVFTNVPETFRKYNLMQNFWNTMILCGGTILIQCSISILAAYALSKLKPRGSRFVLLYFLGTMMINEQAIAIPSYLMFNNFLGTGLNLINNFWSLLLAFSAWGWSIFLLKGFFDGLPTDLLESARIDGAGPLSILMRIVMPLSKPVLAVIALNTFMAVYNQFMFPLILLPDSQKYTIMIRIYATQKGSATWTNVMVLLSFATLPVLLVYLFAQRYIVQGITMTGLKG